MMTFLMLLTLLWLIVIISYLSTTYAATPHYNVLSFDEALQKKNYPQTGGYFHAYDIHSNRHTLKECSAFYQEHNEQSKESMIEMIRKHKLWDGGWISGSTKLSPNDTLFGFKHAMDTIWANQHPADCSKAQFFIPTMHNGGFGSELHVFLNALGLAMDMNRVLLLNPILYATSQWEGEVPFCKEQEEQQKRGPLGFECYYEPLSSCTIYDALGPHAIEILTTMSKTRYTPPFNFTSLMSNTATANSTLLLPFFFTINSSDTKRIHTNEFLQDFVAATSRHKAIVFHAPAALRFRTVPNVLKALVDCSPMHPQFRYYWWRAMSVTYGIRPNARTLAWIESHRNHSYDEAVAKNKDNVVGVYVRRGDKAIEMRLSPLHEYIDGMRLLWALKYLSNPTELTSSLSSKQQLNVQQHGHSHTPHSGKSSQPRIIFLASESSAVLEEMHDWMKYNQSNYDHTPEWYRLYYTTGFDRKGLFAEKSQAERRAPGFKVTHHPEEYLNMLLNLHHLFQADGWVCTIGSNFCRVLDELRATIAGKAGAPFVDLSVEKCRQVPCIYGDFISFDWR